MKSSFLFFLVFITANNLYAQTKYPVPGAQVQPQWVFPIWFEDGNGDRDTVYFCYDPDANDTHTPSSDTVFGEHLLEKDTSIFWVGIAAQLGQYNNITQMVYVSNAPFRSLFLNKGVYPLKIYWDVSLLDSPDLPYSDNSPHPRARIDLYCEGDCHSYLRVAPIIIHGDSLLQNEPYFQSMKDSVVFYGNPNTPNQALTNSLSIDIMLVNYNDPIRYLGNVPDVNRNALKLYPNPVQDNLIFAFPESTTQSVHWSIYDYTGKEAIGGVEIENKEHFKINTTELESGYYILKVNHGGQFFSKPFVKN